jgi:hypothetical protein
MELPFRIFPFRWKQRSFIRKSHKHFKNNVFKQVPIMAVVYLPRVQVYQQLQESDVVFGLGKQSKRLMNVELAPVVCANPAVTLDSSFGV